MKNYNLQTKMQFARLDEMTQAINSLEAYSGLLKQAGADGVSQQTAAILNVGLSSCYRTLGLEELNTGLESYTTCTSRDGLRQAVISQEAIGAKIKEGAKKTWEWLLKMFEHVKKFFKKRGEDLVKLKNRAKALAEELKASKDHAGKEYIVNGRMANNLTAFIKNDTLIAESKTPVFRFAKELSVKFPNAMGKINETVRKRLNDSQGTSGANLWDNIKAGYAGGKLGGVANFKMEDFCQVETHSDEKNPLGITFTSLLPAFHSGDDVKLKARSLRELMADVEDIIDCADELLTLIGALEDESGSYVKMVERYRGKNDEGATDAIEDLKGILKSINNEGLRNFIDFYRAHLMNKFIAISYEEGVGSETE